MSGNDVETTTKTVVSRRDVYRSAFIHAVSLSEVEVVRRGWLVVESSTGLIEFVAKEVYYRSSGAVDPERFLKKKGPIDPSNETLQLQDVLKDEGDKRPELERFLRDHIGFSLDEAILNGIVTLHDDDQEAATQPGGDAASSSTRFLIPGFVDCHAHAPQYAQMGTGLELPLLKWLDYYTFPLESRFKDTDFARDVYSKAVRRFLRNGTTTCVWFGTIHNPANEVLVDVIRQLGQRAFVGKVCMNRNAPEFLLDASAQESLDQTVAFAEHVLERVKSPLITPIVTPRFAPACTEDLLRGLALIAKQFRDFHSIIQPHILSSLCSSSSVVQRMSSSLLFSLSFEPNRKNIPIQSHLSENTDEVNWIKEVLFPGKKYTQVYEDHGLLTDKTIMAHCVHLDDEEVALLKYSHFITSNHQSPIVLNDRSSPNPTGREESVWRTAQYRTTSSTAER